MSRPLVVALVIGLSSCAAAPATPEPSPAAAKESTPRGLAGSAWRLVEIASMDDSVYRPDDRDRYTLEFRGDESMSLRADCNRGSGTWESASPGQLRFGRIAVTRALCPPGSLHDRYLSQFEFVRSYVIENGNLFLATMADGAIIEFEPLAVR